MSHKDTDKKDIDLHHHQERASIIIFGLSSNNNNNNSNIDDADHKNRSSEIIWQGEFNNIDMSDDIFIRHKDQIDQDLHDNIRKHRMSSNNNRKRIRSQFILKNIGSHIGNLMKWIVSLKVVRQKVLEDYYMDELIDTTYLAGLFSKLDRDGDKKISRDELYSAMTEKENNKFTMREIELIIDFMDKDDNGSIDFEEFYTMFSFMNIQSMDDLIEKAYLFVLFNEIDNDRSGKIEFPELKEFFISNGIQIRDDEIYRLLDQVDIDSDGTMDFYEFYHIFSEVKSFDELVTKSRLHVIFNSIDNDNSGALEFDEIQRLFKQEKIDISDNQLKDMISQIDTNNDGVIDFEEFQQVFDKITSINDLIYLWQNLNSIDIGSDLSIESGLSQPKILPIIAGGCGGIMSRSLTAPLERAKILAQTGQNKGKSMKETFIEIIEKQGFWKGLWKGNLYGCLRIFPFAGCVTFTYTMFLRHVIPNKYKNRIENPKDPITHLWRFCAGLTAGCIATTITYPLDLMKANEATDMTQTKGLFIKKSKELTFLKRLKRNLKKEMADNNIKTFKDAFRGLFPTLFAVPCFVGMQNMSYDFFRIYLTSPNHLNIAPSIELFAFCGIAAGITAQSVIYPMDVIRRRIQTDTMWIDPNNKQQQRLSRSWINGVVNMVKNQGIKPLFAGLTPTYLKIAPSVAISVTTRDIILGRLNTDD